MASLLFWLLLVLMLSRSPPSGLRYFKHLNINNSVVTIRSLWSQSRVVRNFSSWPAKFKMYVDSHRHTEVNDNTLDILHRVLLSHDGQTNLEHNHYTLLKIKKIIMSNSYKFFLFYVWTCTVDAKQSGKLKLRAVEMRYLRGACDVTLR